MDVCQYMNELLHNLDLSPKKGCQGRSQDWFEGGGGAKVANVSVAGRV